jgi:hypothetical protein
MLRHYENKEENNTVCISAPANFSESGGTIGDRKFVVISAGAKIQVSNFTYHISYTRDDCQKIFLYDLNLLRHQH